MGPPHEPQSLLTGHLPRGALEPDLLSEATLFLTLFYFRLSAYHLMEVPVYFVLNIYLPLLE